jgi:hypothetical protein
MTDSMGIPVFREVELSRVKLGGRPNYIQNMTRVRDIVPLEQCNLPGFLGCDRGSYRLKLTRKSFDGNAYLDWCRTENQPRKSEFARRHTELPQIADTPPAFMYGAGWNCTDRFEYGALVFGNC